MVPYKKKDMYKAFSCVELLAYYYFKINDGLAKDIYVHIPHNRNNKKKEIEKLISTEKIHLPS